MYAAFQELLELSLATNLQSSQMYAPCHALLVPTSTVVFAACLCKLWPACSRKCCPSKVHCSDNMWRRMLAHSRCVLLAFSLSVSERLSGAEQRSLDAGFAALGSVAQALPHGAFSQRAQQLTALALAALEASDVDQCLLSRHSLLRLDVQNKSVVSAAGTAAAQGLMRSALFALKVILQTIDRVRPCLAVFLITLTSIFIRRSPQETLVASLPAITKAALPCTLNEAINVGVEVSAALPIGSTHLLLAGVCSAARARACGCAWRVVGLFRLDGSQDIPSGRSVRGGAGRRAAVKDC